MVLFLPNSLFFKGFALISFASADPRIDIVNVVYGGIMVHSFYLFIPTEVSNSAGIIILFL